jgi:NTP pyrophosphatase (non-canonical NTP hydrolase)
MAELEPIDPKLSLAELEACYETQMKLEGRLAEIFAPRDEIFLPEMEKRIEDLLVKESFLGKSIRKHETHTEISRRAGTVYSWLACVARKAGVSIQDALESKFPARCAYCGKMPCICQDATRGAADLTYAHDENAPQSLRAWQFHLDAMYGENNRASDKGIWFCVQRMTDETLEILLPKLNQEFDGKTEEELKQEFKLEIADATAWLIAASNLLEIDIQSAVLGHYGNGCPTCGGVPCICGPHYFSADSVICPMPHISKTAHYNQQESEEICSRCGVVPCMCLPQRFDLVVSDELAIGSLLRPEIRAGQNTD